MASEQLKELITIGPFIGIDATTAEIYVKPGYAAEMTNVNTQIVKGAMTAERGRVELFSAAQFNFFGQTMARIDVLFPVVMPHNQPAVLFQGVADDLTTILTGLYEYSGTFTPIAGAVKFTRACQYGTVVYTNGGQRFFPGFDNSKMYLWQYQAPQNAQKITVNWTYAIATVGFHGSIHSGDHLITDITSSAPASITTIVGTNSHAANAPDDSFKALAQHVADDVNDYYNNTSSPGYTIANKIIAVPLPNFNTTISPGQIQQGQNWGVLFTSTASGDIGNTFTISVSESAGATEGYQLTGPTTAGKFYGANTQVGDMLGGFYFYLFTRQTKMPDGTISETSVNPDDYANPLQVDVGGKTYGRNSAVTFTPTLAPGDYLFAGTNPDGSTFTTNIYRQSTNQAGYYLVGNKADNLPFVDTFSDDEISGNAQLQVHRDQPPVVTNDPTKNNLGFVCTHSNRVWVFCVVDNTDTNDLPQCQLWYSNYDRPWEFNEAEQVLLLQSDATAAPETNPGPNYDDPYGNVPKAVGEVGTTLIAKKTREDWVVWGDGTATNPFSCKQIYSYGNVSITAILYVVGGMFFLDASGDLYYYDGAAPVYESEDIRGAIKISSLTANISSADLRAACISYANRIVYLSFPTKKCTLGFDTVSKTWCSQMPYAPNGSYAVATTVANPTLQPSDTSILSGQNEVLAVRQGVPVVVDQWFGDPSKDIGIPYQQFGWTTPVNDSELSAWRKWYSMVRVTAPRKQAGMVQVSLIVDNGDEPQQTFTANIDLSTSQILRTAVLKGNASKCIGFLAQVKVSVIGVPGQPCPVISKISVFGGLSDFMTVQPQ